VNFPRLDVVVYVGAESEFSLHASLSVLQKFDGDGFSWRW